MLNYGNIFDSDGLDYTSYRELVNKLLAEGKTTGPDDSDAMLHYTKMNVQRMNRVDKTTVLNDEMLKTIDQIKGNYHFLVISEGWCGDAAQIVPVINQIVLASHGKFDLKLVLRDQHLPLIDAHLTNGGRAIPVLLILDENKELVLPKWGPRPDILQHLLAQWKKDSTDMMLIAEQLHGWYAKDKTQSTQAELIQVLGKLK
ncbi:thioredoxin family protein [Pedobacter sp. UC225_65]|uniref:thioredoxin family protein n=1 Tax=Pedobacter sp. UC225_65 TaxID=3350173 RepID=UPI0036721B80